MDNRTPKIRDYALSFAAWDLRLYLDTHPNDTRALAEYRKLCEEAGCGNYACLPSAFYGPDRWSWIDDPWPWEAAANPPMGGGCRATRPMMCQRRG